MSIVINESFSVNAPIDRVWHFLSTPQEVVQCIPGAELTEVLGERHYAGRVKVKVGPVTAAYAGKATLAEVDDAARRMTLLGEGRETGGSGSAKLTMHGSVAPNANGGSDVRVDATIDIAGKVMQFGRGLVESVSAQLFKQFVEQARKQLETTRSEAEQRTGNEEQAPSASPDAATATPRERELRVLPLLWRALIDRLRRIFVRRR
ncbi:MAG TPA: SRPBCC family protein [Gemmatimonadaceae bacterium]|nr:SRPBCC family protein [Gemmatimonadaceae bacterium]